MAITLWGNHHNVYPPVGINPGLTLPKFEYWFFDRSNDGSMDQSWLSLVIVKSLDRCFIPWPLATVSGKGKSSNSRVQTAACSRKRGREVCVKFFWWIHPEEMETLPKTSKHEWIWTIGNRGFTIHPWYCGWTNQERLWFHEYQGTTLWHQSSGLGLKKYTKARSPWDIYVIIGVYVHPKWDKW